MSVSLPYPSAIDFFFESRPKQPLPFIPLSLTYPSPCHQKFCGRDVSGDSILLPLTLTDRDLSNGRRKRGEDQKCPIRASIKRGEALSLLLTPFPLSSYTYVEISRVEGRVCRGKRGKDLPTAIEEERIARDRETAEGTEEAKKGEGGGYLLSLFSSSSLLDDELIPRGWPRRSVPAWPGTLHSFSLLFFLRYDTQKRFLVLQRADREKAEEHAIASSLKHLQKAQKWQYKKLAFKTYSIEYLWQSETR